MTFDLIKQLMEQNDKIVSESKEWANPENIKVGSIVIFDLGPENDYKGYPEAEVTKENKNGSFDIKVKEDGRTFKNIGTDFIRKKDPLGIKEANEKSEGPTELKDIAKQFPTKEAFEKECNKHWGTERLTYHGNSFFSDDDWGPVYKAADKAAGGRLRKRDGNSCQEVYVGYDPKKDQLYIGYDAWHEEDGDSEFFGILYELDGDGRGFNASNAMEEARGFYKGIYNTAAFKKLGLFDIRLD